MSETTDLLNAGIGAVGAIAGVVAAAYAVRQFRVTHRQGSNPQPTNSDAARTPDSSNISEPIAVGCFAYPPLMNRHGDALAGSAIDFYGPFVSLASETLALMRLQTVWRLIEASDLYEPATLPIDVVLGLFRTRRREQFYDFTQPIYRVGLQGVCRTAAPQFTKETLASGTQKIVVQEGEVGWEYGKRSIDDALAQPRVQTAEFDSARPARSDRQLRLGVRRHGSSAS